MTDTLPREVTFRRAEPYPVEITVLLRRYWCDEVDISSLGHPARIMPTGCWRWEGETETPAILLTDPNLWEMDYPEGWVTRLICTEIDRPPWSERAQVQGVLTTARRV